MSLFRGGLKRAEKPATTEAVRAVSFRLAFGFVAMTLAGNLLARETRWGQARGAMSTFARSKECRRAFVGTFISAAFFWTLLLSASPQLHARIHADANRGDHTCAVTLIATGNYDHAAHPPLITAPQFIPRFSEIAALSATWVPSLFLNAHIFEHAPPARG